MINDKEPKFIKIYESNEINRLISKVSNFMVLCELMSKMDINNHISVNAFTKSEIITKLGISKSTLDYTISTATSSGLLIRLCRGLYLANKEVFGHGGYNE
jgi:predicted XRE-type DNA-binding protein